MFPETFSQFDEEPAILKYFDSRPDIGGSYSAHGTATVKRFLDVGAWDAKDFSNTRALFLRGWGGVLIDPAPKSVNALMREYAGVANITVVSSAVALEASLVEFHITEDSLSTSVDAQYERWRKEADFVGKIAVPTITFPQIFNRWGGFDFINIDAEGVSVDLFHHMLASGGKPPCCCVEHDGRLPELARAATFVGYKIFYANDTNAVLGQ
jgi:FkbM family methyltransferase